MVGMQRFTRVERIQWQVPGCTSPISNPFSSKMDKCPSTIPACIKRRSPRTASIKTRSTLRCMRDSLRPIRAIMRLKVLSWLKVRTKGRLRSKWQFKTQSKIARPKSLNLHKSLKRQSSNDSHYRNPKIHIARPWQSLIKQKTITCIRSRKARKRDSKRSIMLTKGHLICSTKALPLQLELQFPPIYTKVKIILWKLSIQLINRWTIIGMHLRIENLKIDKIFTLKSQTVVQIDRINPKSLSSELSIEHSTIVYRKLKASVWTSVIRNSKRYLKVYTNILSIVFLQIVYFN